MALNTANHFIRFVKKWTLLIAMTAGVIIYFIASHVPILMTHRGNVMDFVQVLMPSLLFMMLFLEFNKLNPKDFIPKPWIGWLFLYQILATLCIAFYLMAAPKNSYSAALEGMMTCILSPTATAVAVMSSKLGGKAASATTYAVLSSLLAAVAIPLIFPLVSPGADIGFISLFGKIFSKVFPVIILPLLISFFLRWQQPAFQQKIAAFAKDKSFYLWSICITINAAQITRILICGFVDVPTEILYAVIALALCLFQFALGKILGHRDDDLISGGQSMGQKNTILAIWMSVAFLSPAAAIIPGAYMIWQNIVNAVQLSYYGKKQREE